MTSRIVRAADSGSPTTPMFTIVPPSAKRVGLEPLKVGLELFIAPELALLAAADAAFAVCCAVPIDAPGITMVARPAGRPGEKAAIFSNRYGQSTAVVMFDKVFVPWEKVFFADEWEHSGKLTHSYATHHRHSCIGARAGFGDLLIGAGALMCEANGFNPADESHLREQMVELIKITEGLNPTRSIYLCLKDERKIPLTPVQEPTAISNLEEEAASLAKFLDLKLENL
jgi:hypothetical protein